MKGSEILAEGKTKVVICHGTTEVNVFNKDTVTIGDAEYTWTIPGKGAVVSAINHYVMNLLAAQGVVSSYYGLIDPATFCSERLDMLKVECVCRVSAEEGSSYLARHPETKAGHVFESPVTEGFFKSDAEHDPIMIWNPGSQTIELHAAKKPLGTAFIRNIEPDEAGLRNREEFMLMLDETSQAFGILNQAFKQFGYYSPDGKAEFGRSLKDGKLKMGDVFDCESWRLQDPRGREISKQYLRDLKAKGIKVTRVHLNKVLANYGEVLSIVQKFSQAA